jgi:tellurite resistance protein TehA-like permease
MMSTETDTAEFPTGTASTLKTAASHVVGHSMVAGLAIMAYGATLVCWISEQVDDRRAGALAGPA